MDSLKLEIFLSDSLDRELSEYKILEYIKRCRESFNRNKLYPELAELRLITSRLETIVEQRNYIRIQLPKRVRGTFSIGSEPEFVNEHVDAKNSVYNPEDLIEWALPKLHGIIEEGLIIYDFVMQNLRVEAVGDIPSYKDEGYFLIPDNRKSILLINQYECSVGYAADKQLRAIQTRLIRSIPLELITKSALEIKEDLLRSINFIKNPPVFYFKTDLDFDFAQTILPIAKKKLISAITI